MPGKPPSLPTLFDRADAQALRVPTSCGRTGRCRECVVEVLDGGGHLSPRTAPEGFLRDPFRLACQAQVDPPAADVVFDVVRRRLRIVTGDPAPLDGEPRPRVAMRDGVVCWGDETIGPPRPSGRLLGVALDVGTTTVAFELVDLRAGSVLEVVVLENPQRFGGSDVMNRISYDSGPNQGELRYALRKALNEELVALYRRHGLDRRDVYEMVVVGNATMRDLFFGLPVASIGERPYKSETELELRAGRRSSTAVVARAHELGLWMHPQGRVWGAPLIASHVGADVAADLIDVDLAGQPGISMLVDVGTNTEVVLAGHGRMIAASCPAGPAFEGGEVACGMQAADGAVESVRVLASGELECTVIGDVPPLGLCGSGLVDLIAELIRTARITPKGVFADKAKVLDLLPGHGITFTRADASALAQAKAANTVGQQILLRELGISPAEVDRLYLAGGFAQYVDVEHAIAIGFLAPVAPEVVVKLGNASLRGARRLLLDAPARERLEELVPRIEHIELESTPDFFELFVDACQFKPIAAGKSAGGGHVNPRVEAL